MLRRAAALTAVLLLTACSDSDEEPGAGTSPPSPSASQSPTAGCDEVVDDVVDVVQRYVEQYAPASASGEAGAKAPDLPRELRRARTTLADLGCSLEETSEQLRLGLDGVEAEGPLALAVKQQPWPP